ncbi:thiol-disulfide isomerase/thioredoxin [Nocardiopsis aegyptia]|uniref:Thiol-disulfide isomerase/thioredoxin n=2 Tax=Nocardiopsis aegyptia TaxID=220378 RepID=A0A7Z0EPB5_9ACTN|nr:thiol-disulfide isomerase/thioredoxin [Nocardiopsis aegyptia]
MDAAGLVVLAVTLLAATAVGLAWRRGRGRFREHTVRGRRVGGPPAGGARNPGEEEPMTAHQDTRAQGVRTQGAHAEEVRAEEGADTPPSGDVLTAGDIDGDLGERATLVQFSTAFCQPCRATRRILDEVAGMVAGVAHVEVDAEASLDLVRRLGIMRTPTVLVLDASGRITTRASGQPRKADVIAALGAAVP